MQVIDETSEDLCALIEADLGKTPEPGDFHRAILDWLQYRARTIPMRPRCVSFSTEALNAASTHSAISAIASALRVGADVSPWLSERIRSQRDRVRADTMFNHWQITHFHLGIFAARSKVTRTAPLLYAYIGCDDAVLLDVLPHGAWFEKRLLEILLRTKPSAMARFEMKGALPNPQGRDYSKNLARNNYTTSVEIDGRLFIPGLGVATSGHSTRLVMYASWFFRALKQLKEQIAIDRPPLEVRAAIYAKIGVAIRLGVVVEDGALSIVDKNRMGLPLYRMRPIE